MLTDLKMTYGYIRIDSDKQAVENQRFCQLISSDGPSVILFVIVRVVDALHEGFSVADFRRERGAH